MQSVVTKYPPISFSIIVADFNRLSLNERRYFTGASIRQDERRVKFIASGCPTKPYFMPFQYCLHNICEYAQVGGKAHFLDRKFLRYASELVNDTPNAILQRFRRKDQDFALFDRDCLVGMLKDAPIPPEE
jgi:hypothetical protein